MNDVLDLQRLPQIDSLDLDPCNLAVAIEGESCTLCSHTCCCTAHLN